MESKQRQVLNLERVQKLQTWLETTNTKLTQVNGQRKYGGPPLVWNGPMPGSHCEVFISQIPRDTYEDLLIPLFSSVGPLWEFRLMMNFSGQNRGFAYAKYGSPAVATNAIRMLHGYMMEPGLCLSVRHSTEKRHLVMEDLPASTRQEDLLQVLRGLTQGVERVSVKAGPGMKGVSAIIAFSSHYTASMAKKGLVEAFSKQYALTVSIKWQSSVKPSPDKPPQKNSLMPSPLKLPHHIPNSPHPSVPPPRLARPATIPPGFCRAVGGPTAPQHPPNYYTTSSSSQGQLVSTACPMLLLRKLCEATGLGLPLYDMCYSHAGPDGFLYFTYKVCIPGITTAFTGKVMILPGPSATSVLEEARQAAAQRVLEMM